MILTHQEKAILVHENVKSKILKSAGQGNFKPTIKTVENVVILTKPIVVEPLNDDELTYKSKILRAEELERKQAYERKQRMLAQLKLVEAASCKNVLKSECELEKLSEKDRSRFEKFLELEAKLKKIIRLKNLRNECLGDPKKAKKLEMDIRDLECPETENSLVSIEQSSELLEYVNKRKQKLLQKVLQQLENPCRDQ